MSSLSREAVDAKHKTASLSTIVNWVMHLEIDCNRQLYSVQIPIASRQGGEILVKIKNRMMIKNRIKYY